MNENEIEMGDRIRESVKIVWSALSMYEDKVITVKELQEGVAMVCSSLARTLALYEKIFNPQSVSNSVEEIMKIQKKQLKEEIMATMKLVEEHSIND